MTTTTETTSTTETAAGIAIACDGVVYGVGDTFATARRQAIECADGAAVPTELPCSLRANGWVAFRVTAALRRQIEASGAADGYRAVEGTDYLATVRG